MEEKVAFIFTGLWGLAMIVLLIVNIIPQFKAKVDSSDIAKKASRPFTNLSLIMTAVGVLLLSFFKHKVPEYFGIVCLAAGIANLINAFACRFTGTPINRSLYKEKK
mgnify:FL=1